eukprot:13759607-Alexandrium_andersonii.AAC.1
MQRDGGPPGFAGKHPVRRVLPGRRMRASIPRCARSGIMLRMRTAQSPGGGHNDHRTHASGKGGSAFSFRLLSGH